MIVKALGLETDNRPAPKFKDVSPETEGYDIIATIADEGIMDGNADGEFLPNDKLTRGQMAAILVSAFKLEGTTDYTFRDVPSAYWASGAIQTLFAANVTTGYPDNTYKPTAFIYEGEFCRFPCTYFKSDNLTRHLLATIPITRKSIWSTFK